MDKNAKYDLSSLQDFFTNWYSPEELKVILQRIALNMTLRYLDQMDIVVLLDLKDDLVEIKNFIVTLEEVKRIN